MGQSDDFLTRESYMMQMIYSRYIPTCFLSKFVGTKYSFEFDTYQHRFSLGQPIGIVGREGGGGRETKVFLMVVILSSWLVFRLILISGGF